MITAIVRARVETGRKKFQKIMKTCGGGLGGGWINHKKHFISLVRGLLVSFVASLFSPELHCIVLNVDGH